MIEEVKVDCHKHGTSAVRLAVDQFSSMASTKNSSKKCKGHKNYWKRGNYTCSNFKRNLSIKSIIIVEAMGGLGVPIM